MANSVVKTTDVVGAWTGWDTLPPNCSGPAVEDEWRHDYLLRLETGEIFQLKARGCPLALASAETAQSRASHKSECVSHRRPQPRPDLLSSPARLAEAPAAKEAAKRQDEARHHEPCRRSTAACTHTQPHTNTHSHTYTRARAARARTHTPHTCKPP